MRIGIRLDDHLGRLDTIKPVADSETTNPGEETERKPKHRTLRRPIAFLVGAAVIWIACFVNLIGWGGLTSTAWPIEGDQVSQNWWLESFKHRFWGMFTGGHLFGWTDDFGAGQPFGYFYFPLPAIFYSLISVVVGGAVAVKIIQVAGVVLVIGGIWAAARAVQANKVAVGFSVCAISFGMFYPHRYPVGADLSSIFIGEYSYSWGYGLAWWAIARIIVAVREESAQVGAAGDDQSKRDSRWRWVAAGILVAAAGAGHANAAFVVGVGFIPYYVGIHYFYPKVYAKTSTRSSVKSSAALGAERDAYTNTDGVAMANTAKEYMLGRSGGLLQKSTKRALTMAAVAGGLLAFWLLPMWSMREEIQGNNKTADIPLTFWFSDTFWRAILVLGVIGILIGWVRKSPLSILAGALGAGGLATYETLTEWHGLSLWAGRTMPLIYTVLLIGVGELLTHLTGFGGNGWVREADKVEAGQEKRPMPLPRRLGHFLGGPKKRTVAWRRWSGVLGAGLLLISLVSYGQQRIQTGKDPMSMEGLSWKTRMNGTWLGVGVGSENTRQLVDELVAELEGREGRILFATSRKGFDVFGAIDLNGEILRRGGGSGGGSTFFHEGNRDRHSISFATSGSMTRAARTKTGQLVLGLDDFATGIEAMRQLGIRYYIIHEAKLYDLASQEERLKPVKTIGKREDGDGRFFAIYEIDEHAIVQPLNRTPGIVELFPLWGETTWDGKVREWIKRLGSSPYTGLHLARTGPEDVDWDGYEKYGPAVIKDVKVEDEKISFTTDSIGTPVVVRMGYAPQWKVRGGDGPYHGAPHTMIVIPTSETVEIYYDNPATERVGLLISVLSSIMAIIVWRKTKRGAGRAFANPRTLRKTYRVVTGEGGKTSRRRVLARPDSNSTASK